MFIGYVLTVTGMVFEAEDELKQYLTSINPMYAKYTARLWAEEVNSAAQLGNASLPVMHAFGVKNPFHAGDSLPSQRQQASGAVATVVSPLVIVQQVEEAVELQVAFELI